MSDEGGEMQPGPTPLLGIGITLAVMVFVAAYQIVGGLLGIQPLWAGYLFSIYYGLIERSDVRQLPKAVAGSLAGVAMAAGFHHAPALYGGAGLAVMALLAVVMIYLLIMQLLPFFINPGLLLLLTVGAIPAVAAEDPFLGMAASIALAVAVSLLGLALGMLLTRRRR